MTTETPAADAERERLIALADATECPVEWYSSDDFESFGFINRDFTNYMAAASPSAIKAMAETIATLTQRIENAKESHERIVTEWDSKCCELRIQNATLTQEKEALRAQLQLGALWARQVSTQDDVRKGIRSAAERLADRWDLELAALAAPEAAPKQSAEEK